MFYYVGLNTATKAKLSGKGPRGSFATFMKWMLENNGSQFTVWPAEENICSPTPEPETSQPSSHCTEQSSEPTADGEPEPAATREPASEPPTEPIMALEPEPQDPSDKVCEPETLPVPEGVLLEIEGLEGSPTHTPAAEACSSALSPLVPVSPSTHPQSAPSGHSDLPRAFSLQLRLGVRIPLLCL
ncbi:proteoglycan 4-like [Sinocyclocheilus grahami]|uniref:proteoglycan 4-like n=1 Tax=Sinocyclocheilus grahami TaxID=75366 RepID=UPI0007ACA53C|nr:PREDICTED: proteoglycan 4-like [Sinocyclocheilus grahami]